MRSNQKKLDMRLLCSVGFAALAWSSLAQAETQRFNIPAEPLAQALARFGAQGQITVVATSQLTNDKTSRAISGASDPDVALTRILEGTGLTFRRDGETYLIVQAAARTRIAPLATIGAAETLSGSAIEGLTVTAQKRREAIQDVPIAISAFSADTLQAQKIEGGFDLLKAIPNVTFSKTNFSGYNFTIRGIGTKGISVATDPGVAVEFNDTPLIRNRLFEQEYFDVERVEVLRGPQGTLHGRNATAGVINVLSNKADLDEFDGSVKGEVGNYHTKRLSGFVNVPLIEDVLAMRFAGALTAREGYDFNTVTNHSINGRDLWSGRLSIGFTPTERMRADFIWERFNEDDNRSRTGKQLCTRDPGPSEVGGVLNLRPATAAWMSQGCLPGNMYDDAAFGTPNGLSIPFILATSALRTFGVAPLGYSQPIAGVADPGQYAVDAIPLADPYGGMMQSRNLREIASLKDPIYRAQTDVLELNANYDVTAHLTFTSQTAYTTDQIYSFQDYNRFNTVPIFADSSSLWELDRNGNNVPSRWRALTPGGVFCDPQLGCSRTIAGFDISQAKSKQFSQEFRLQSDFDGPWNFSVGANYTHYRTVEDYYVMFNLVTLLLGTQGLAAAFNGTPDITMCTPRHPIYSYPVPDWYVAPVPIGSPGTKGCTYIDPNPVESINGEGHNYFRSMNPYTLKSMAAFGELYWQAKENLKVTFGLRYTDDNKVFTPVPSQLMLSSGLFLGGSVDRGYPAEPDIEQQWGEFTGRLGFDWKPDLAFTDETLIYSFISRGYKGGGANPPGIGFIDELLGGPPGLQTLSYPKLFEPEFVNAFEIGTKNTLIGGALVLNLGAFYYDYKNYQVSQIKERTSVNENFDATVWGLEMESIFSPSENWRFNLSAGYQDSEIADGEQSIDLMDRLQGHGDVYTVFKPWVQLPSNCVIPKSVIAELVQGNRDFAEQVGPSWPEYAVFPIQCGGFAGYPLNPSGAPNDGQGFYDQLGGNELPNAPHFTVSLGGQYEWDLLDGNWHATVRGDAYWQSQSWARVYNNDPYDKLHGWYNTNLSFWLEKPAENLKFEFYVKNVLDGTPITDSFLNSDDTGLTTNVFTLDPRLIGLSVTKGF